MFWTEVEQAYLKASANHSQTVTVARENKVATVYYNDDVDAVAILIVEADTATHEPLPVP